MNVNMDIKALIHLYGLEEVNERENIYARQTPAKSGIYRPHHKILDGYLTTGVHFYNRQEVQPGETVEGIIKFIAPNEYPNSLWINKKIDIQEGYKIVGYAIIKEIYNKILEKSDE